MFGIAVRARGADAYSLGDVIDPQEHQIEPPGADATAFELLGEIGAEDIDDELKILRIAEGLGKAQLAARHFR